LISQLSNSVENLIDQFFTNGVVTSGVVVGSIFFAGDKLFGVEELTVCTSSDLINYRGFQIHEDSTRHMFASTGLTEESVEGIVSTSNGLVTGHLSIGLDTMFQAVQLPTGITDLATSLSNVDRDTLTHDEV